MKKILSSFVVVLMLVGLCSCAQEPGKKAVNATALTPAIEKLGDVEQIYEKSDSRFVTGETLLNYKGNTTLVFIGNLVEYNSLTKDFADYVETVTKEENAAAHQSYPVTYDASKKYVEFCAFINKMTGEVVEYEIRVYDGDFVNKCGVYYAKSCLFNNTLTRDLTNKKDVDFGFTLDVLVFDPDKLPTSSYTYDLETGELTISDSKSAEAEEDVSEAAPPYDPATAAEVEAAAGRIGTIAKMYDDEKAVYVTFANSKGVSKAYYVCMVEYTAVNDRFTKLFEDAYNKTGFSGRNMVGHSGLGMEFNAGSSYIELIGSVDSKTGKISGYELRKIDIDAYKKASCGCAVIINVDGI